MYKRYKYKDFDKITIFQYKYLSIFEGIVFLPVAVDTLGGWHEDALKVIDKLGRQLARAVGRDEAATVAHLKQRLGVVLLRDNAGLLASRAPEPALARVTGQL